jgi:hypothetical protein
LANILTLNMEKEYIVSQTRMFLWETGRKISLVAKEYISTLMGKNIKENFNKDLNKGEELIYTKMHQYMKESGPKIGKMASEFSLILMAKNMKEIG